MVKDTFKSILDNLKERTTNPFLGTLIVVWLIKNWKLVYSLFYFDSAFKLEQRLKYISTYFENTSFFWNMVSVVMITLGVLILTYLLLSVSRLITDGQEKLILPIISKWTDKSSIVLKSDYIKLQEVIKQLELRLEEERLAKVTIQNERDRLDEKLAALPRKPETEYDYLHEELEGRKIIDATSELPSYKRVADKVFRDWDLEGFNDDLNDLLIDNYVDEGKEVYKVLLREGFIEIRERSAKGMTKYQLTEDGQLFLKYWNNISFINEENH
ncbi:MAG: hypothetical protein EOO91_01970 [Pedobacter sp.]|nr:MAG: hypothetical protein EOO91_01970 [Pedobacter sp.]